MTERPKPSGTIAFLFTDIEGSTRLWEQHPEAMWLARDRRAEGQAMTLEDAIAYALEDPLPGETE
jgi:class 3 adenylate cyclase